MDSTGKCQSVGIQIAEPQLESDAKVHVVLSQQLRLGPFQSKIVKACTSSAISEPNLAMMVTPNNNLANLQCDFIEEVWEGKSSAELHVTNWSGEPRSLMPGDIIGNIEYVSRVSLEDRHRGDSCPAN